MMKAMTEMVVGCGGSGGGDDDDGVIGGKFFK